MKNIIETGIGDLEIRFELEIEMAKLKIDEQRLINDKLRAEIDHIKSRSGLFI